MPQAACADSPGVKRCPAWQGACLFTTCLPFSLPDRHSTPLGPLAEFRFGFIRSQPWGKGPVPPRHQQRPGAGGQRALGALQGGSQLPAQAPLMCPFHEPLSHCAGRCRRDDTVGPWRALKHDPVACDVSQKETEPERVREATAPKPPSVPGGPGTGQSRALCDPLALLCCACVGSAGGNCRSVLLLVLPSPRASRVGHLRLRHGAPASPPFESQDLGVGAASRCFVLSVSGHRQASEWLPA